MIHWFTHKKTTSGFTLIELLVVIAIIGVLATIVLASLNNARIKARDARRVTDIKQLQIALELYLDGVGAGSYPVAGTTCTGSDYNLQALVTNGYISTVPRDPQNVATCYNYRTPAATPTVYHLAAVLEDTNNPSLKNDKDCDDATVGACAATVTFAGGAGAIKGAGSGVSCLTATGPETCYDVTP